MDAFGLPESPHRKIHVFKGNAVTAGTAWQSIYIPKNFSMCEMFVLAAGGGGGQGVVGANSTAAGGGGGGSGSQTIVKIPTWLLPEALYISVGMGLYGAAGIASYVAARPITTAQQVFAIANGGGVGGNAAGATAGAAGAAGSAGTMATSCLGGAHATFLGGQAGIIGGTNVSGANLTLPTTGLRVTGGTGGGGLPAAAATGTSGGSFTVPGAPSFFPAHSGGVGSATATNPAAPGSHGYQISPAGVYFYGGTGAASTHGTATGAGLAQGRGGDGGTGSGGGGNGGALTASAVASRSKGGDGLVIICFY